MCSIYGPELKLAMLKFLYSYSSLEWTMITGTKVKQVVHRLLVIQSFNALKGLSLTHTT